MTFQNGFSHLQNRNLQQLLQPLIIEFMPQVSPKAPTGDERGGEEDLSVLLKRGGEQVGYRLHG